MMAKDSFNHFENWWNIKKLLDDKQYVEFDKALCKVQFLECHIDEIRFEDKMLQAVWEGVKYTIKQSLQGFFTKKGISYDDHFKGVQATHQAPTQGGVDTPCQAPYDTPCQAPCQAPTQGVVDTPCQAPCQPREKEKEKEKEYIRKKKIEKKERLADRCKRDSAVMALLDEIGAEEEFIDKLIAYRRKVKPLKSEHGVKGVLRSILETSQATGKSADELLEIMQEREWLTIRTDYLQRNQQKIDHRTTNVWADDEDEAPFVDGVVLEAVQ